MGENMRSRRGGMKAGILAVFVGVCMCCGLTMAGTWRGLGSKAKGGRLRAPRAVPVSSGASLSRLRGGGYSARVYSNEGVEAKEGESSVHVCSHVDNPGDSEIGTESQPFPAKTTLHSYWDLFQHGKSKNPNAPCLEARFSEISKNSMKEFSEMFHANVKRKGLFCGKKRPDYSPNPYLARTYLQVEKEASMVAGALKNMGLSKGDRVGIFAKNMPNWAITQLACASQGYVVAPIYETIGPDAMRYIINHSEAKVIFCSVKNFEKVLNATESCPTVKNIVVMDDNGSISLTNAPSKRLQNMLKHNQINVHLWNTLFSEKNEAASPVKLKPSDTFEIMYTSGTTGKPKGVVITHKAFIASIASISNYFNKTNLKIDGESSTLSYLPLAHIFEQTAEALLFLHGASVGYYRGDVRGMVDDLKCLKPTIFIGVPQVFERIKDQIKAKLKGGSCLKKALFWWGFETQKNRLKHGLPRSKFWDRLIFNKIRNQLFKRTKICISGAAPLSAETQQFLQIACAVPVIQGYGLTETCAGMCIQYPGSGFGSCGAIMSGAKVKLRDVAEMNYVSDTKNGKEEGEVLVKGPQLASGYYKDTQKTKQAWTSDGWFMTGDIGRFNTDGSLSIVDRKKSMFKLAQGEYVSPEHLESTLSRSEWVRQVWVYGKSSERYVVAILVPNRKAVIKWGESNGEGGTSFENLCRLPKLREAILTSLQKEVREAGLPSFQRPVGVHLESDLNELGQGFSIAKDMLTPTFKFKRAKMAGIYSNIIDDLYANAAANARNKKPQGGARK